MEVVVAGLEQKSRRVASVTLALGSRGRVDASDSSDLEDESSSVCLIFVAILGRPLKKKQLKRLRPVLPSTCKKPILRPSVWDTCAGVQFC